MSREINLAEPFLIGNYKKYIKQCLDENWISTGGKFITKFEKKISNYLKIKHISTCINGTSALDIAIKVLGISKNDEVLVPTLTFIAPINAIIYNNSSPIFFDCDDYCNIDIDKVEEFLEKNTIFNGKYTINKKNKKKIKAIIIVHVFGNAVDLIRLIKICKNRNIKIIEDSSESFGTKYKFGKLKNRYSGTIGDIGCFSFNGNKIVTAGIGGAIVSSNKNYITKSKYLINQAKDRSFDYIHNSVGYNYRLSNLHSAIGLSQIESIKFILNKKIKIRQQYSKIFKNNKNIVLIKTPEYSINNNWLNVIYFKNVTIKKKLLIYKMLEKNKIFVRKIWQLNHLQAPYKKFQIYKINKAIKIQENSLCLPSGIDLKINEINKIGKIITDITKNF